MKRTVVGMVATAAVVLIAGCGSNDSASSSSSPATTTEASTTATSTSAMASSAAEPSADMTSSMMVTPTGPTISAGGSSTELDAQSTAWFTTLCSGLSSVVALEGKPNLTPAEAGELLTTAGNQMTATGQALAAAPPPTFTGGVEAADNVVKALTELGPSFVALGQKAATIQAGDTAAEQQFTADMQQTFAPFASMSQVVVTPETKEAVAKVPACAETFGS